MIKNDFSNKYPLVEVNAIKPVDETCLMSFLGDVTVKFCGLVEVISPLVTPSSWATLLDQT